MKLFDTKTKGYVTPDLPQTARIYVCGITPYDSAHLGHIFTFMQYDLLRRRLEDAGHTVEMVRNVTDVDEPIYRKAAELGIPYTELAAQETAKFQDTLQRLNFIEPEHEPLASQYILQMSQAVQKLLDTGDAYRLENDIYFNVANYPSYLAFSGFSQRLLDAFAADRGGDPDRPGKKNPHDFLLWKGITDPTDAAQWETTLGKGRPGWHIECTIMSGELLGLPFDIHGGGTDLIFPHHSAELAQAEALGNAIAAAIWTHVSPLSYAGEKMSKSLGNLVFAHDLLEQYDPSVIRLALMEYHHRIGGEWQPELLESSKTLWSTLQQAALNCSADAAQELLQSIRAALDDDLNTLEIIDALTTFNKNPGTGGAGKPLAEQALKLAGLYL